MEDIMNNSSIRCQEQSFLNEPMFLIPRVPFVDMVNIDKKHPKTVISFVENLENLLKATKTTKAQLALKCGLSTRYIDFLLKYERYPSVEIAEQIAAGFGLTGWQMLIPGLHYELAKSGKLTTLVTEFSESSKATQDYVSDVLHRERKAL